METCIFSDNEIKNSVHKSLIDSAAFQGRQVEILESIKDYTKGLNDNAVLHAQHLEKIESDMARAIKYILPAFALLFAIAFIAIGGGAVLDKALRLFGK